METWNEVRKLETREPDKVALVDPENNVSMVPPIDAKDMAVNPAYADWGVCSDNGVVRLFGGGVRALDPEAESGQPESDSGSGEGSGDGDGSGDDGGGSGDGDSGDGSGDGSGSGDPAHTESSLGSLTKAELIEVGASFSLELSMAQTKAEMVAAILAAQG